MSIVLCIRPVYTYIEDLTATATIIQSAEPTST